MPKIFKSIDINILKKDKRDLIAILVCFFIVFAFCLGYFIWVKANLSAKVQFTADTEIILTGLDTNLYVLGDPVSPSECDSLTIGDPDSKTLKVDIPDASSFTLKTAANNVLRLTPAGGTVSLTFSSAYFSSGYVSQWTEQSTISNLEVSHLVGVPKANTYYAIEVNSVLFNSFKSNDSGEVSFTYDSGFSPRVFTTEEDTTAPTEFDLVSPVNSYSTSDSTPTFSWNPSDVPDLDNYALYIDGNLNIDNISGTSVTLTSAISCGSHTWYVKAVDKAGNSIQSASTFTINISCPGGSGLPPVAYMPPTSPSPTKDNPQGGFKALINKGAETTDSRTITLTLFAGSDTKRMAISEDPEFTNAVQEPYQSSKEWTLSEGDGKKTIYVKFYTKWGQPSQVFSTSIILKSILEKPIKEAPAVVYEGIPAEFTFEKKLKYGDKNDDVKYLQIILKTEVPETYLADVPATGWFGPITKVSVIAFQEKYVSEILAPWDLTTGTGFVGKTTRAKLNGLLAAVPTGEKEVTPEISGIPADYKFTIDLQYGQTSDDIRYLQIFLKARGAEIYPEGIVSGWFGPLTKKAVIRFQEKYASDILTPWDLTEGTGFVGKTTRAKINEILGK